MTRGIDHVVHAVHDLDAAASLYERLGFQVGSRNRHPWGTHNRVVQLAGSYVELLTVAEPERIPPHGPGSFSFGAFNNDFLRHQQGIAMTLATLQMGVLCLFTGVCCWMDFLPWLGVSDSASTVTAAACAQ